jgi:hypothetical protein
MTKSKTLKTIGIIGIILFIFLIASMIVFPYQFGFAICVASKMFYASSSRLPFLYF